MEVDIYIRERYGSREIRIPWLPEKIKYSSGGVTAATYDIMDRGEVTIPTGTGLSSWSWESTFPGANRDDYGMTRGTRKEPKTYHNILNDWREGRTPLHLLVTGYPINADVLIADYNGDYSGGFGDIEYELKFKEDRDISIASTTIPAPKRPSGGDTTTYTIVKGDTLWGISRRFLGSGAKWEKIYTLNKDIIEKTAKQRWKAAGINRDSQHGHWIFPGTKIKIPK